MSRFADKCATMKALIIYDNFAFAAKANMILQRAARKADATFRWTIRPWKSDVLRLPPGANEALTDAMDAHLIAFAGQHAESLPLSLQNWLERWVMSRKIKNAALAVIGDERSETFLRPAMQELFQLASRHGLEFIPNGETATEDRRTLFSRSRPKSNRPPFPFKPHFVDAGEVNAHSHWGINE